MNSITLLELHIHGDQKIWIADGVEVPFRHILGIYIKKMRVYELPPSS